MGRHREFDVEKVLDAALCVFWRKGYEGTSYADLTEAAGVERPALYSAFGNKEALFRQALDRYSEQYLGYHSGSAQAPTAREVAAHVLHKAVDLNTRFPDRTGCLGINGALAGSDDAEPVRQALIEFRARRSRQQLRERFERAKAEGDLPETAKPGCPCGIRDDSDPRHSGAGQSRLQPRHAEGRCRAGAVHLAGKIILNLGGRKPILPHSSWRAPPERPPSVAPEPAI